MRDGESHGERSPSRCHLATAWPSPATPVVVQFRAICAPLRSVDSGHRDRGHLLHAAGRSRRPSGVDEGERHVDHPDATSDEHADRASGPARRSPRPRRPRPDDGPQPAPPLGVRRCCRFVTATVLTSGEARRSALAGLLVPPRRQEVRKPWNLRRGLPVGPASMLPSGTGVAGRPWWPVPCRRRVRHAGRAARRGGVPVVPGDAAGRLAVAGHGFGSVSGTGYRVREITRSSSP